MTHGSHLREPGFELLLDSDPDLWLASAKHHDPCEGGPECDAMCVCSGAEEDE